MEFLNIDEILPNPFQPRKEFDMEQLAQLAKSIKEYGIIEPLIVRINDNDEFELIAGERRLRAAKMAGLDKVPIILKDYDDDKVAQIALIENLQRSNLNVIEETNYSDLIKNNYLTTLDKILDIDTNKIFLIDIKTNNNYKVFSDILMNTINKYNKNIYLASFDKNIIKYIKSKYKKGIITLLYRRNNYNFIITNYKLISNNKIKKIKDKEIFLWTIHNNNELEEIKNKFSNIDDYYIIKDKKE